MSRLRLPSCVRILPLIIVAASPALAQLRINSNASLPGATLAQPYSFTLIPAAGTATYSFTLAGGALPTGVNLSTAGVVAGTPTAAGSFTFTARVTDATLATVTKQFTLDVAASPLGITPTFAASVPVGNPMVAQWVGTGGTAPYNYSIVGGALPLGLNFESSNCFCRSSGRVEGTPLATGPVSLVIAVTDSRNRVVTSAVSFNVNANPLTVPAVTIPTAFTGQEFSFQLPATGQSPINFSLNSGSMLPPGMNLFSNGRLTGTIATTTPSSYPLFLLVTDASGSLTFQSYTLDVVAPPSFQIITSSPLPTAVVGIPVSKRVFAVGPSENMYLWSITGTPPPGISIESDSGVLVGTPTTPGDYNFTIHAVGPATLAKDFTWHVASAPPFFAFLSPFNLVQGQVSRLLSPADFVNGTPNSFAEVVGPTLPDGIDNEPGISPQPRLFGTPRTVAVTSADLQVTATDGQFAEVGININVMAPPALQILTSSSLPIGVLGTRYRFTDFPAVCSCVANGGVHPYRWSISAGALPPGLSLTPDGVLSGVPTGLGIFTFTVQLSGGSTSVTRTFDISVSDFSGSVTIPTGSPLPGGTLGASYNQTITAVSDSPPEVFSIVSGSLPNGLTLSPGGVVSGTPTQAGTFNFTIGVTDNNPEFAGGPITATKAFSLTIISLFPPPQISSLSPSSRPSGSGLFTLTVNGLNFLNPATVMWNSTPLITTFNSSIQLTAQVPGSLILTPGSAVITVVNTADGQVSGPQTFTITGTPPQITSLIPNVGAVGGPPVPVTVNGSGFYVDPLSLIATEPRVRFAGSTVTSTFVNSNQLTATFNPSLFGLTPATISVDVMNPDGQISNVVQFRTYAPPVLTQITPNNAPASSGDTQITLTGTSFALPAGIFPGSTAQWNGVNIPSVVTSPSQIIATIPANLLLTQGTANIRVVSPAGLASGTLPFNVTFAPATVTRVVPNSIQTGAPAFDLRVEGANFGTDAQIELDGQTIQTFRESPEALISKIPDKYFNLPGTMLVSVRALGVRSNEVTLTVVGTGPTITSLDPSSRSAGSGPFLLTVDGAGFRGDSIILFNNQPLVTNFPSSVRLTATVPGNLILTAGIATVQVRNGDGLLSAARNFPITSTTPQITFVTPNSTQAGGPQRNIVIAGANFMNGALVRFNGTDLTPVFDSPAQLTAIVPAALLANPGAFVITVHNPDNQFSNAVTFTVTQGPPPPQLTTLQPPNTQAGGAAFNLTVNGANFATGASVRWNGQDLQTQFISATQLIANVPATLIPTTGTHAITVRNPDAQVSNVLPFTVGNVTAPLLTLLNPNSAAAGGPAFTLTATGTGFQNGAVIRWNGQDLVTSSVAVGQLSAQVPATLIAAAGNAAVTVRNPDGQISNALTFAITTGASPVLTSLSPSSALAGNTAIVLIATGTGFQTGAVVRWNTIDLTTTFLTSTQLTAQVPASLLATAGSAAITVRNPGGLVSNALTFPVVTATPLTLTLVNPSVAFSGGPAFSLNATGTGFQSGSIVRWNNTDLPTAFGGNTQLTAQVPASLLVTAGAVAITVRNPGGQISNAQAFTVTQSPAPILSFVSPPSATISTAGMTLFANGLNFQPGAVILWNNVAIPTTVVANTQVSANVPANLIGAAGSATLQVRNPDNQVSNPLVFFIRAAAPLLNSVTPPNIQAGAEEITLTVIGSNFVNGATVMWNGTSLPTSFVSAGQLFANVLPATLMAQPGTASISVRNPDSQTSNSSTVQVVAAPPALTSLSPSPVFAGTPSFQLTARGSGFRPTSQIRWNGQLLVTSFVSGDTLTATVPADLILVESFVFVTVVNTDGQTSNALTLQVQAAPAPEITSLSPGSTAVNTQQLALTVQGRNFLQGTQVYWNSSPLVTAFNSATQLTATVPASFLNAIGVASVSARNPDGKISNNITFSIGDALRITSSSPLPNATMNAAYSFQLTATGGARPYRWRLASTSEALPQGLTLGAEGALTGTPRVDGTFSFTVEALDAGTGLANLRVTLVIENPNLDITSTSPLPPATAGIPYSYQLRANATPNVTLQWSVVEGALPPGLSLNAQSGLISGMPEDLPEPSSDTDKAARAASVPVLFNFRIQVAATNREPFRKSFDLTVLPSTGNFRITTAELPSGTENRPYRFQIATAGGTQPIRFSGVVSGQQAITLSSDGAIAGTPTAAGVFNVTVNATDGGGRTATQTFTLTIQTAAGPIISSGPLLPIAGFGRAISYPVEAIEGVRPYTWAIVSGTLPPGVTFDPVTARITGATQTEGLFRFVVRVTDASGRVDLRTLELPVTPTGDPLELVTPSLPTAILGRNYTSSLSARGGKEPYTWTLISGALPTGLSLSEGQIIGVPTQSNTANVRMQLADSFGFTVARDYALRVDIEPLPSIVITGLPDRINPGQQPQLGIESSSAYPVDIIGRIDADFSPEPAIAGIDPALQFSTGGRQADFRIPSGQTRAAFPQGVLALQTGTVAGAVTLRLTMTVASQSVTAANRPDRSVRIVQLAPVISTAALERRANGFTINITGFSTTREISEAIVVLTPVPGRELQATRYTVALTEFFRAWFANPASLPFGTQFRLALPFDGDNAAVQSLTIQLRNSEGVSEERRISF